MPRPIVLSNGSLFVGYSRDGQIRDFYFPYVGLENQTGGNFRHRLGVWIDTKFAWLDEPSWQVTPSYKPDTLVSGIVARNQDLGIELNFSDVVYNEKDIYLREIIVQNLTDFPKVVKIYFNQQFEIYESWRKDTAFYDPHHHVVIHYKGRRVFLINACCEDKFFDQYSTGLFDSEGHLGTYVDAQDGELSANPIEHGQVDSVIGITLDLVPHSSKVVHYWITASKLMEEAYQLNEYVLDKGPDHLLKTTRDYWFAWTHQSDQPFADLSKSVIDEFRKSLLIVRSHVDNNGGILASCDSDMLQYGRDTYSYVWPRDGSFTSLALDKTGDHQAVRRFIEFCRDIIRPEGYFMHKYRPDQALGSSWHPWIRNGKSQLPIQEDETALVIITLWQHYQLTKDLEFVESVYNSLVKKTADFMVSYRDPATHLPWGSYDLWERVWGTSTFTASSVSAALVAAANISQLLGKTETAAFYTSASDQIKKAILKYLYDEQAGYFYKHICLEDDGRPLDKTVDISSAYGIFNFQILPPDDIRLTRAVSYSLSKLALTTPVGGIARFDGDAYYRNQKTVPGNPWFICTLWLAQYYLTQVKSKNDFGIVAKHLSWVVDHAMSTGILSEQLDPVTGAQISAAPLTWSHAEFITTVLAYLEKYNSFTP